LEEATRPNLEKLLKDVVGEGEEITVTDPALPFQMSLRMKFQ
jgi:ubiquitin-activating enzyme E1 C